MFQRSIILKLNFASFFSSFTRKFGMTETFMILFLEVERG